MDLMNFQAAAIATPPAAEAVPSVGYPTDGDPPGGVPATVPGAAWFYQVLAEMHAVLAAAGVTPNDADLGQLNESIGKLIEARVGDFSLDTGTANAKVVALNPAITAYTGNFGGAFKNAVANTSAVTVDFGAGPVPLVRDDGVALAGGDLPAGFVVGYQYIHADAKAYITTLVATQHKKRIKVGTFTRDMTASSGNQTISGLGFTPSRITFSGRTLTGSPAGLVMGFTDGVNQQSIGQTQAGQMYIAGSYALELPDSVAGAAVQSGSVLAAGMVYDQFTVAWTKTGAPAAGTASIIYKAEE